jgi:hypothetical protein
VPPAETNALFLPAAHWQAFGGYDTAFVSPGGGLVNLDTWARLCADPQNDLFMLLGEATFHQVHGGIATNSLAPPHDLFAAEYQRLRGRPYERPSRKPLFLGSFPRQALRSVEMSIFCPAQRDVNH